MKLKFTKYFIVGFIVVLNKNLFFAQTYAPPVGQAGCTALYKDSSAFVNWVTKCKVVRGLQDISTPSLGLTNAGDSSMVLGKADGVSAVSLGDGGYAICQFEYPITNASGFDFAVFENSFNDTFLELAFVEVSSDGINFFRLPAHSKTDTLNQTQSFGNTDATKINNLAGKYRGSWGTPFDLQDLAHLSALNTTSITHVKIIDVVGSLDKNFGTRDFYGNKINDPWPTPFPSGGFDLEAIGVIHQNKIVAIEENKNLSSACVYPNPVSQNQVLSFCGGLKNEIISVYNSHLQLLYFGETNNFNNLQLDLGLYFIKFQTSKLSIKLIVN